MKRTRKLAAVATVVAVSLFGFAGTASAQSADDVAILVENLPAAGDALAAGLQNAADTLAETQSAEQTSAAIGQALVDAGSALVAGTEQFGALATGFQITNFSLQTFLRPYLQAIDDPATAGDAFDPNELSTLLANLAPAGEAAQPFVVAALIDALEGELLSSLTNALTAVGSGFTALTQGTSFTPLGGPLIVVFVAAFGPASENLPQLEDALAPVFEGAAPVTDQVIGVLQGL